MPAGTFAADVQSSGAYDHQLSRWLPTTYLDISPDGSRYAYADLPPSSGGGPPMTGVVHIVDIGAGSDHIARTPGPIALLGWHAGGLYVESIVPESDAPAFGLSVINPDTLALHQITSSGTWQLVGDNAAYSVDLDPADPHPPVQNGPGPRVGNRVERMDLSTGAVSPFATINGASVTLLGLDAPSQNPWIAANTSAGYSVMGTPYRAAEFTGPDFATPSWQADPTSALSDSTGTWFASANGTIWQYGPADAALRLVAATGLQGPGLAGPCT
jgi:hypothetical protein